MNIVLEGNINFYDELNKLDTDDENENICLLTNLPLDKNSIKLPCNHEFNFIPLYKEIILQKTYTSTSHLNSDKLLFDQIKCPYCRQKFDILLPHVKLNNEMRFIPGINSPEHMCMKFHTCQYTFKIGINKGNVCSKNAYYDVNGCFCNAHHRNSISKKQNMSSNNMISYTNTILHTCSRVLKTGKRVGQLCGAKITDINSTYCKRHKPK